MVSDKQRIMELEERLDKLESIIDEMVRVVSIQNKNKER